MKKLLNIKIKYLSIALAILLMPELAIAGSGSGLGWEGPLTALRQSLSGPVAFAISIIGIFGAGAGLIFGGEMSGFLRSVIILVMVISLVVASNNFLSTLFGVTAAVLG